LTPFRGADGELTGPIPLPGLTPLAAAGLVIIMVGATVLTLAGGDGAMAMISLVAGLLSAFVAYGRWRLALHSGGKKRGVRLRD